MKYPDKVFSRFQIIFFKDFLHKISSKFPHEIIFEILSEVSPRKVSSACLPMIFNKFPIKFHQKFCNKGSSKFSNNLSLIFPLKVSSKFSQNFISVCSKILPVKPPLLAFPYKAFSKCF